jgi:hypothetical protein
VNVVDRLTGGGRGEKLEKMLEKKKLELSAAKEEGVIKEEDIKEVL